MTLSINLYGFFLGLACLSGFLFLKFKPRHDHPLSQAEFEDLILIVVPLAVVGARLYHVFTAWDYYAGHLWRVLFVWQGGLGIFGALAGGVLGVIIFAGLKQINVIGLLDWLVVPVPLMQAIGRLGNVFNGELLPFAYYEIILDLAIFALLFARYRYHESYHGSGEKLLGEMTALYLAAYGLGRFVLEFTRVDRLGTLGVGNVGFNQMISLGVVGLGVFLWMKIVRS